MSIRILFPTLLILGVFFLLSAFFSGAEAALLALSRIRLRHMVERGARNAKAIQRLVNELESLIATILVGNNLVNVAISVIAGSIFISIFGAKWGVLIGTLIIAFLLLALGEVTPKMYAVQRSEFVSQAVAIPMLLIMKILWPFAKFFTVLGNWLIKIFGGKPTRRSALVTEEEIRMMIELGKEEGILGDEERKMLHRIFEFGDTRVADIMVPVEKITSAAASVSVDELLSVITEGGHSRIPVYKDSAPNIIGVIYARELLHLWENKSLIVVTDLIHSPYLVPKGKRVIELLRDFQEKRVHIAFVTDEKEKIIGMLTLEDLLEEIVGEIEEVPAPKIA